MNDSWSWRLTSASPQSVRSWGGHMKEIKVLLYLVVSRNEGHADKRAFNRVTACLLENRHTNISCFFNASAVLHEQKCVDDLVQVRRNFSNRNNVFLNYPFSLSFWPFGFIVGPFPMLGTTTLDNTELPTVYVCPFLAKPTPERNVFPSLV